MNNQKTKRVSLYYESIENRLWDIITNGHIHLGYWDESNRNQSFRNAALQLTKIMIQLTNIKKHQKFCDLGCGLGIPAILLAKKKGCYVDGITISSYQQKKAFRRVRKTNVKDLVTFWRRDALHLPFTRNTYDGGWFFESIFHMGHYSALKEAHRILKHGAQLLIADVVDIGIISPENRSLAESLCNAIYITPDQYPRLLKETGFSCIEVIDITKNVMEVFEEKFRLSVKVMKKSLLLHTDELTLQVFENIASQIVKSNGYIIVNAIKE